MHGYYVFGEITLTDDDWVSEYLHGINAFIAKHGGEVLSRSINMERLEGDAALPTNVILIGFATKDEAEGFFTDADYQPLRERRIAGSRSIFTGFPAEDLAEAFLAQQAAA